MSTTHLTAFIVLLNSIEFCIAIDCFKCISINNDYPPCEDPFHNNFTKDILESPCMGGRKGREGLFPATSCVKINGVFEQVTKPNGNCTITMKKNNNKSKTVKFKHPVSRKCCILEDDNEDTITLRGCALDSGTLTTDTELVRMSHCGGFYYSNRYVRGCVQSCNDADACNSAETIISWSGSSLLLIVVDFFM